MLVGEPFLGTGCTVPCTGADSDYHSGRLRPSQGQSRNFRRQSRRSSHLWPRESPTKRPFSRPKCYLSLPVPWPTVPINRLHCARRLFLSQYTYLLLIDTAIFIRYDRIHVGNRMRTLVQGNKSNLPGQVLEFSELYSTTHSNVNSTPGDSGHVASEQRRNLRLVLVAFRCFRY